MTTLFHTSPTKIEKINNSGRFGEFLFFAYAPYQMAACEVHVYALDIDESDVIDASRLFYHQDAEKLNALIDRVVRRFGVSEEDAEALIEESASIYDVDSEVAPEDLADASWDIQRITAQAAKILGFRGVRVTDEQGGAVMVDMMGREKDLVLAK